MSPVCHRGFDWPRQRVVLYGEYFDTWGRGAAIPLSGGDRRALRPNAQYIAT